MASERSPVGLSRLLDRIEHQLLPQLQIHSPDLRDPVVVKDLPRPWRILGCGNYAAVLLYPRQPALALMVYCRIGTHPADSRCFHVGSRFLLR